MLKTRVSFVIGALLASGLCLAQDAKPAAAPAAPPANANIAVVNGVAYPLDLFRMFFLERLQDTQGQQGNQTDPAFQQQVFNEFMTMVVAAQEAQKRKLQDLPEVTQAIEVQRLKVMSNAALGAMAQDIKVTDDELKALYEQVKKDPSAIEYKARQILVKDEAEAKKIIKELDKGADFGELAKKKSVSTTVSTDGGDLGWFGINDTAKPIVAAVAQMKPGTYSKEPVKGDYGWHIINLQETRVAAPPSFEEIKPKMVAFAQRQKLAAEVAKLRDAAKVELNEEVVKVSPKTDAAAPVAVAPAAAPAKKDEGKK